MDEESSNVEKKQDIVGYTGNLDYTKLNDVKLEFQRVVENVKEFYEYRDQCEMIVKINGDTLSQEDRDVFIETFGDYTDKIHIEHIMSCWPNFELNGVSVNEEHGIFGQEIKELTTCPYVFYSFSINSDGLVSACFIDWSKKLIVGDVKT
jgi:hypothetical protein